MTTRLPAYLALLANIKLAHWQANTHTNEHEALGDLYDSLEPLVDKYAEMLMGKRGEKTVEKVEGLVLSVDAEHMDIVSSGFELLELSRGDWEPGRDDDMLNVLADMSAALTHAKFFLML